MEPNSDNGKKGFFALTEQLGREIRKMRNTCDTLQEENDRLRKELASLKKESDLFSNLNENQKMVLKQQINDVISKLDTHIEGAGDEVN